MSHRSSRRLKSAVGSLNTTLSDFRCPPGLLFSVASDLYESLNTPVSLSCEILLRYGDLEQLVRKTVVPRSYNSASQFADDYQAVSFLKKAPLKIQGVDPEAAAKIKFLEAEEACRQTNSRIRSFSLTPHKVASDLVVRVLSRAVGEIGKILGSEVDCREWIHSCRFGPGVFNHPRSTGLTSLYDKLQVRPSVSHDLADLGSLLVMSQPHWARSITDIETDMAWPIVRSSDLDLVPGNKVAFVPKTAVTHRAIAIEPLINIYAQLGLGAMLRRRLLRHGMNLNDQSANQRAALKGSSDGSLATIDLSSASDTVAKELVRFLLPERWFHVLDICRSKVGMYEGKWLRYEKFSSMGNGSTFELETLIFLGLSLAVCTELNIDTTEVLVYGDDIVIPVAAYDSLFEVLTFCGFMFNDTKSFKSGPFRESCGKDYFNGHDVRPFFQKELPDEIQTLFRLVNGIRMLANRRGSSCSCDRRLLSVWRTVLRAIPRSVARNLLVPAHAGDSEGIKCDWDEAQASPFVLPRGDGWEGFVGLRYQAMPVEGMPPSNMLGLLASLLMRLGDDGKFQAQLLGLPREGWTSWLLSLDDRPAVSPRQLRGSSYRLRVDAFYGAWTDLGPWL